MPFKDKKDAAANNKKWKKENPDKVKAKSATYYAKLKKDPVRYAAKLARENKLRRPRRLKYLYNLTIDDYNQMLIAQDNVCKICGEPETAVTPNGVVKPLSVEHDHSTGKIRGLVCSHCNHLLGHAKDDIDILYSAIEYLKTTGTVNTDWKMETEYYDSYNSC